MDNRTKSIIPGLIYDLGEEVAGSCPKLILTEPYNRENYSIVLKSRATYTDLINIISKLKEEKLNDKNLSITFHYATRPRKTFKLVVTMNKRALELVSNYF